MNHSHLNHSVGIKNTRIKTIAAATLLACSYMQSAYAETFNFQFSNGGATATGSLTTVPGIISGPLTNGAIASFAPPASLNVVVAGASSGNGSFVTGDFSDYVFTTIGSDFTANLVGQAGFSDFNLFGNGAPAPRGIGPLTLTSNYGFGTPLYLSCLFLQGYGTCGAPVAPAAPAAQQASASYLASTQTVNGVLDSVQARLEGVRDGTETDLASVDLQQGKVQLATNGDTAGLFDAPTAKKHGFWAKAFGARGSQEQSKGFSGYSNDTYGTAFGADTLLADNWLVGAAFTYARTGVDLRDLHRGDDTNIKTYQLTGYTTRDFGTWYVDGMVAYAKQDYDSSRNAGLAVAKGDFSGDQYAARVHVGMPFAYNDLTITPMAGLEYNHLKQDSYTEKGAGAASLNVRSNSKDRVRSVLGAKVAVQKDLSNGYTMTPSIRAAWRHDFNRSGLNTTGTVTGGGAAFNSPGQKLAQDSISAGAGLSFQKSKDFSFSVLVDGEIADSYDEVSGQLVGQWKF